MPDNDTPKPTVPTGLRLTPMDPEFRECPHQVLDRLRAADPVHADHVLKRLFLTRFEDVRTVVSDRALSSDPRKAAPGSYHRRVVLGDIPVEMAELSMLHLDDPEHRRIRGLVVQAFNQRATDAARPGIRAIAEGLLDGVRERDGFDVIADYATPLPIIVIARLLGVNEADLAQFKRWSDAMAQVFNPARTPEQAEELGAAEEGLHDYFTRMIDERRRNPGNDIISGLVTAEARGDRLSEAEIALTCNLLLIAGNLTTTDLIGNGVLALLRHPDQLSKLRERPDLAGRAVEEMLRYDPPVAQTSRVTTSPLVIGGVSVPTGESVTVSLLAAGRDPARHQEPDRFDITRDDTTHLAFGGGTHYCLGAPLARAEAEIAIPLLFERFPGLRLDPAYEVVHKRVPVFNGLAELRVLVAEET